MDDIIYNTIETTLDEITIRRPKNREDAAVVEINRPLSDRRTDQLLMIKEELCGLNPITKFVFDYSKLAPGDRYETLIGLHQIISGYRRIVHAGFEHGQVIDERLLSFPINYAPGVESAFYKL